MSAHGTGMRSDGLHRHRPVHGRIEGGLSAGLHRPTARGPAARGAQTSSARCADQRRAVRRPAARGRGSSPIALDWSGDAQTSGRGRRGPWNATGPMPAPALMHAPANSTRRAPRTSGTHPSGSTSPPPSRSRGPSTRNSSVRQRTRIHCKEAAHRHQRRRRARNITHSSRAFRPNPGPRNTRTPGQPPPADNTARASALRGNVFPGPRWGRGARLVAWQSQPWAPLTRDGGGEPRHGGRLPDLGGIPAVGPTSPTTEGRLPDH